MKFVLFVATLVFFCLVVISLIHRENFIVTELAFIGSAVCCGFMGVIAAIEKLHPEPPATDTALDGPVEGET